MTIIHSKINELNRFYTSCKEKEDIYRLSEIDTQVIFVEPVLELAGWTLKNPLEIRRASRDNVTPHFDIEAYLLRDEGYVFKLALECKSIESAECNLNKFLNNEEIGSLFQKNGRWQNKNGDGAGQLRKYSRSFQHFDAERTIPILTNGFSWAIFNRGTFLNNDRLSNPIANEDLLALADLSKPLEFEKIIEYIRKES